MACLGISRTIQLMRACGLDLFNEPKVLADSDAMQSATLARLFPGISLEGIEQASLCNATGGLGVRKACDTVLAAALASLILARPKVAQSWFVD